MKMFLSGITQHIKLNSSCSDPLLPCCCFSVFLIRVDSSGSLSRREQKRAQYQHVKAHMQKEDGRVIAHGWSLPGKCKARVTCLDSLLSQKSSDYFSLLIFFFLFFFNDIFSTYIFCKISIIVLLSCS